MNAFSSRAISAYANIGVETGVVSASPQQLIQMLFEGASLAVASARQHLRDNKVAPKCESISRAISIIDGGLKASLDMNAGSELAQNLSGLYGYMTVRLLHANLKNDPAALEEVGRLLQQLASAWSTLAAKPAAGADAAAERSPRQAATAHAATSA